MQSAQVPLLCPPYSIPSQRSPYARITSVRPLNWIIVRFILCRTRRGVRHFRQRWSSGRSLERAEIVVAELELRGGDVFFEVSDRRGAGNRQHHRRSREQPRDAYLRGRGPKFFGQVL